MNNLKYLLFDLFNTYNYNDEIIDALRSLVSSNEITVDAYNELMFNYNNYLDEWEEYHAN